MPPRAEWLSPEAMARHRPAWADLAGRALEPDLFGDPAFALPAALHLPRGRRPRFLAVWAAEDASRLIGVCPMAPSLPGLPRSAWLHPQAVSAFPLLDAAHAETALATLLAEVCGGFGRPALLLAGVPTEGATMRALDAIASGSVVSIERRARAALKRGTKPTLARSAKEFRRQARRLAEMGTVADLSASAPDDVAAALETFLALEAQGWKGRRGTALVQTQGRAAFARETVLALTAERRCRIDSLSLDGRTIAAGIVLRSGPNSYFWKTAYDERFARLSPGVHLAHAIGTRQSLDPEVVLTDSCAHPGHTMIDPLWPDRIVVADVLVGSPAAVRWGHRAELARRAVRTSAKRVWRRASAP